MKSTADAASGVSVREDGFLRRGWLLVVVVVVLVVGLGYLCSDGSLWRGDVLSGKKVNPSREWCVLHGRGDIPCETRYVLYGKCGISCEGDCVFGSAVFLVVLRGAAKCGIVSCKRS